MGEEEKFRKLEFLDEVEEEYDDGFNQSKEEKPEFGMVKSRVTVGCEL